MFTNFRKLLTAEAGVAAVETAIMVPVYAALLFICRDVFFMTYTKIALQHAANVGARVAVLGEASTSAAIEVNLEIAPGIVHTENLNSSDTRYILRGISKMFEWQFRMGLVRTRANGVEYMEDLAEWTKNEEYEKVVCWLKDNNPTAFDDLMYSMNAYASGSTPTFSATLTKTGGSSLCASGGVSIRVPVKTVQVYSGAMDPESLPSSIYCLEGCATQVARITARRTLKREDGWLSPLSTKALSFWLGQEEITLTASAESILENPIPVP